MLVPRGIRLVLEVTTLCAVTLVPATAAAQDPKPSVADLKKLSVEQLMGLQVTSVSKNEESLGDAAAAVTVVTNEDIRRSGATSIPDILRMVPGLHVARQTSSAWVVASRGFSSVNSEKLLVLSDTRSIYTPLFSGVFWDVQDHFLQDVDRIEVIRGPGATLWGSNAVNGVINITTKSAKETQGLFVETGFGSDDRANVAARYGGRMAGAAYYRVFAKYIDRGASFGASRTSPDDWQSGHAGFRMDWEANARDELTLQADVYRGDVGQLAPSVLVAGRPGPQGRLRVGVGGGNVLARWRRRIDARSDLQVRVYYDRSHRGDPMFVDDLHTVDADVQHRIAPWPRHEVTWGAAYRAMSHRNEQRLIFALDPASAHDQVISGFVQDQIRLLPSLRVTVGTKLERNDFSGFEVQPGGRAAWQPGPAHTVWGAVSRAVRVPTRFERDIAIDVTNPAGNPVARLVGNRDFAAEKLLAYEGGYRWSAGTVLSTDVAVFHNRYSDLASLELRAPFFDAARQRVVVPIQNLNLTGGHARGVETAVTVSPQAALRLSGSYAHVRMRLDSTGADVNRGEQVADATPRHQFGVRASVDLPRRVQVDAHVRRLSAIRRLPTSITGEGLPAYSELNLRVAWLGWKDAEISVVGQNLLHAHHPEFGTPDSRGEIERSVHARVAWGF